MSLSDRYFNQATIKSRLIFHLQTQQHMPNFSKKSDYRISADFHMYVNTCISAVCSIWRNENKNIYKQIENNASTRVTNCFSAQERVILVFINTKKKKNIRVSKKTVRHESTYNILFLTRHNESINVEKTTILTPRPRVSLARYHSADDITIDCWWCHNDQTIVAWSRELWYLTR